MTVQLLIDGKDADFGAFLRQAMRDVMLEMSGRQPVKEFVIEPEKMYSLKDVQVQNYFGVHDYKRPVQAIISLLAKAGISPITKQKSGTRLLGSQILEYMQYVKESQTSFLKPE